MKAKKTTSKVFYEVLGVPGDGHTYKLGFTSNKTAFQRASGWPMKKLRFNKKVKK
jgi:hypothetical protein